MIGKVRAAILMTHSAIWPRADGRGQWFESGCLWYEDGRFGLRDLTFEESVQIYGVIGGSACSSGHAGK